VSLERELPCDRDLSACGHEEGERLNFMLFRRPIAGECFGESLSGDSTSPAFQKLGRPPDSLGVQSATSVPLEGQAQKASPSLAWAKSQPSFELVFWNLDSGDEVDCGYWIIGEEFSQLSYGFSFAEFFESIQISRIWEVQRERGKGKFGLPFPLPLSPRLSA